MPIATLFVMVNTGTDPNNLSNNNGQVNSTIVTQGDIAVKPQIRIILWLPLWGRGIIIISVILMIAQRELLRADNALFPNLGCKYKDVNFIIIFK